MLNCFWYDSHSVLGITGHKDTSAITRPVLGDDVRPGDRQADDDGPRVDDSLHSRHGFLSSIVRALHEQLLVLGPGEAVPAVRRFQDR